MGSAWAPHGLRTEGAPPGTRCGAELLSGRPSAERSSQPAPAAFACAHIGAAFEQPLRELGMAPERRTVERRVPDPARCVPCLLQVVQVASLQCAF